VLPPAPLSADPAQIDPAHLLALVRAQFSPHAASVRHLSGERDLNFLVEMEAPAQAAPARYVLKVSDSKENPAALALQNATLEHLALHAPQLPVQRLYRWQGGAHMLALPGPEGVCYARMLAYLPGLPLHDAPASAAQRQCIGAALGALDQVLPFSTCCASSCANSASRAAPSDTASSSFLKPRRTAPSRPMAPRT